MHNCTDTPEIQSTAVLEIRVQNSWKILVDHNLLANFKNFHCSCDKNVSKSVERLPQSKLVPSQQAKYKANRGI